MVLFLILDRSKIMPELQVVKEGDTAIFKCISSTKTKWYFNYRSLPKNAKQIDWLTLEISKVYRSNRGYYSCEGWHMKNSTIPMQHFVARATLNVIGEQNKRYLL